MHWQIQTSGYVTNIMINQSNAPESSKAIMMETKLIIQQTTKILFGH